MTEIARPLRMPPELPATAVEALDGSDQLIRYQRLTDRAREIRDRLAQTGKAARSQAAQRDREAAAAAMYADKPAPKVSEVAKLDAERERLAEEQQALGLALGRARGDLMIAARRYSEGALQAALKRAADAHERASAAIEAAQDALADQALEWAQASWWRQIQCGDDPGRFSAPTADAMISGRLREIGQRIADDGRQRAKSWADAERDEQRAGEQADPARVMRERGAVVF